MLKADSIVLAESILLIIDLVGWDYETRFSCHTCI